MANNNKPKYDEVTPDMIAGWKAKQGDAEGCIHEIKIPVRDALPNEKPEDIPSAGFILAVPSRTVVDRVAELGHEGKIMEANKVMIANSVLAGDIDIMERDGNIYEAVLTEIQKLRRNRVAAVKKL